MPRASFAAFHCSLSRSLDVMGDCWSPLVLRDISLGIDTFEELARDLGVSRALLKNRLDRLVDGDVLERVEYSTRPQRFRYVLTTSGRELVTVLLALTQWGDRWHAPDGPPIVFRHHCGEVLEVSVTCRTCSGAVHPEGVSVQPGPGGRAAPGTLVIAERLAGMA
ncbi:MULTISPECIES: helix-turn-helix domain-containing protein [Streptomyces]|uniref:winged helix-turn-helix transcriptional regulator n=1 Tax=Streptomyces TaxID=1883 RepID=UPI002252F149|nr:MULTISPECIES: helix-turn-helix domain-containing protein [Streptomyces]MCX4803227.1 helix-turn-helix transcriptional regulator [Streptomyces sp. NBC_01214]WSC76174.1 helix-turn-helix transcriptional regulator [Streptomyces virginiae]